MAKTPVQTISIKNSEFGISLGNKMFRNEDFERRMAEVQRQIEEIRNAAPKRIPMEHERSLSPPPKSPPRKIVMGEEGYVDDLYAELDRFYEKPKKHASPTRRLRQQIDAAVEQKSYLSK